MIQLWSGVVFLAFVSGLLIGPIIVNRNKETVPTIERTRSNTDISGQPCIPIITPYGEGAWKCGGRFVAGKSPFKPACSESQEFWEKDGVGNISLSLADAYDKFICVLASDRSPTP